MAEKKERKTEIYRIFINNAQTMEEYKGEPILKKVFNDFFNENLCETDINIDDVFEIKPKNLKYWVSLYRSDNNVDKVKLSYVIHNRRLNIRNVTNFKVSKQKNKNEGDEEKQHFIIKHYEGTNKAVLIFEKVLGAVTVGNFEKEINKYFHLKYSDSRKYDICIMPVPSPEFLHELAEMKKISLLKVTVDTEKATIDEDISFSGDNACRDELEMVFKPFSKMSLSRMKVENYYKNYIENRNDGKIKRIIVEGKKENNRVRLDTEGMRLSKYIKTEIDLDGVIDTDKILQNYVELLNKEFKDYLSDIVLDINDERGE